MEKATIEELRRGHIEPDVPHEVGGRRGDDPEDDGKRLYIRVTDESGALVYETWQGGGGWNRATLLFSRTATDRDGATIGLSLWD